MVGNNIGVIGERFIADCADAFLFDDLAVHELAHLSPRSQLAIPPRVVRVIDAANAQPAWMSFSHMLPAATEERFVNRA
jgi:hypothetical protein